MEGASVEDMTSTEFARAVRRNPLVILPVGALEEHGIRVLDAESGTAGLDALKREPDVDAVLMDMMMPGLDGFDSIRMIRSQQQFRELPIIAVTARAMKGDREKCIDAGATDYISKPVDVGQLLQQLQLCLSK